MLTDTSSPSTTELTSDPANDLDDQLALALALIENLERKNQSLLSDVEDLRKFLIELESIIRAELSKNPVLAAEMVATENK